jgi:HD-GYP domain-containing protein (c-di-GMP phosphodiesterase class II)
VACATIIRCRFRLDAGWGSLAEGRLRTYVGLLAAFAVALAASWIYWYGVSLEPPLIVATAVLAGVIVLGDVFSVRVNKQFTIGTWDIGLMIATVVLGPTWAAVASLPSAFYTGGREWLRTAYELGRYITIVHTAGLVFSFVSEPLLVDDSAPPLAAVFYGTLIAGASLLITNEVINGILVKVKYDQTLQEIWQESWQPYLLSDVTDVLTAGLGVLALLVYGPVTAVVGVAGAIGSQMLVYRSREQVKENKELRARVGSLEEALATSNMTFGAMIIQDLGRKDGYTNRHAAATAMYATDLAREMRLGDMRAEQLRTAGLLHNIGLFGLPENLLVATGKLNSIAQQQLAEHPARGEKALAAIPEFEEMASWVRWHHERPDGRGYPDKLRSSWIPLEAKILAVAQAYAAMVLDQPQRPGMVFAEAREKLSAGIDTEFDGVVVRAFLRILDTESEGYRMADDHRFIFPAPEEPERARPAAPEANLEAGGGYEQNFSP